MKLGICTGGGDCAGLNAAIAAVVQGVFQRKGWEIWGILNSFNGLLNDPPEIRQLLPTDVSCIGHMSGTVLGTASSNNPFSLKRLPAETVEKNTEQVLTVARDLKLDALIVIGGDGTQTIAHHMACRGLKLIGIPKTIDNDLAETERTLGFDSAVASAVHALDCLTTTAKSHSRAMILELMGRHAGHLTLQAGLSCGACAILIPEIPFSLDIVAQTLNKRLEAGLSHHLIVVAEGAHPIGSSAFYKQIGRKSVLGGIADHVVTELSNRTDIEVRGTVLGHIQRGAPTTHFDRLLAHRFAAHAIELIAAKKWNQVVVAKAGQISAVPLEKVAGKSRCVSSDDPYLRSAKELGISFGC